MNKDLFDLSGRVAIVTGTSRGLGQYMARALAKAGADLVLTSRDRDHLQSFESEIKSLGGDAPYLFGSLKRVILDELHSLVLSKRGDLLSLGLARLFRLTPHLASIGLSATVAEPTELARFMVPREYGRIINIGSVTSVAGYAGLGPYGASRGGIRQLTMSLADDWGKHGITVNCLAPGWFRTEQNKVLYENKEWVEYLCDRIPMKRPGQPNDLESAVVFLAAESSRYITGQTLRVDGGISTGATRALVSSPQNPPKSL